MSPDIKSLLRRVGGDQSGAVAVLVAAGLAAFIGLGALVVDLSYLFYAHISLQAATNAAAIAGAQGIGVTGGTPIATATAYSALAGDKNALPNLNVAMASGYPALLCLSGWGVECTTNQTPSNSPTGANVIEVQQTATVPVFFAKLWGFPSWHISATAVASARGGVPQPLNIAFILDTTKSMGSPATGPAATVCPSSTYADALDCALAGIQTLLGELWPCQSGATCPSTPAVDQAALFIFPGVKTVTPSTYKCSASLTPVAYNSSPKYEIVSFLANYRTSDTATTVVDGVAGGNSSSDLVDCVAPASVSTSLGNSSNTSWEGGEGTYYADAITAAQSALTALNNGATNVIILLTDGNAYYQSGDGMPSSNDCKAAATAAQAAAKAGTWVYAVYYDDNGTGSTCANDSGKYTGAAPDGACYTLQQIASSPSAQPDASKFYSTDGTSSPCPSTHSYTKISDIFTSIGASLTHSRLIPTACAGSSPPSGC